MLSQEVMKKALNELNAAKKALEEQKKAILIDASISANGNQTLIKLIKEKGLPKYIIVDHRTDQLLISNLSYFAPVTRSYHLQHPSIYMSWLESAMVTPEMPELFEYKKIASKLDESINVKTNGHA